LALADLQATLGHIVVRRPRGVSQRLLSELTGPA
jgi:hypothetical protein